MPTKKTVRKPIEKLSEKEHIEVIEDSSSEEESDEQIVIPPPSPLVKEKPKRVRTAKQLANDQRLRDAAAARRAKKAAPAKKEVTLDTTLYKGEPIKETPQQDPDDKPLTMKQYKALIASQKAEVKPKRKYTKREKKVAPVAPVAPAPAATPTPPVASQPNMMFV
tara:strand:+ start:1089 stop:1583 length:495 start_codon:yes stop_codon:yes gene_type:complete